MGAGIFRPVPSVPIIGAIGHRSSNAIWLTIQFVIFFCRDRIK